MSSIKETEAAAVQVQQVIDLILVNWESRVKSIADYYNQYDNSFYQQQIAPGRNRAVYILGHLVASNDGLNLLFGFRERQYPELEKVFQSLPDGAVDQIPDINEIRKYWADVNSQLLADFKKMTPTQWLEKHNSVSDDDFKKDPNRNKLNVLISRLTHLGYHIGQLKLLKNNA